MKSVLTANAKALRKNMTKEERHIWYDFLKKLPFTVNRQKVIGKYIVDFYCSQTKTVIELDGSQHYETEGAESDMLRDEYLNGLGIRVLRYSNYDVNKNFSGVCTDILEKFGLENISLPLDGEGGTA
ncbi:MAG: endonuclease domain-containing protein [Ruminococcaceae bacterium]|nr:endonuclease domain-containing protein [Oscillospiraceae bacterium]